MNNGFENVLAQKLVNTSSEKTYIDKVLSKDDSEAIRKLILKTDLERKDILELLYLLTSQESKLVNYSERDRYVVLKFFIWVREFVKLIELYFDFIEDIDTMPELKGRDQTMKLVKNIRRSMEHMCKFLVDLYLNIARTSLSVSAKGFSDLTTSHYELQYNQNMNLPSQERKGWFSGLTGGGNK
jgi:hypothetical protein